MVFPLIKTAFDFVFPPQCFLCRKIMQDPAGLCPDCFSEVHFITDPLCRICGQPFSFEKPTENICSSCYIFPPSFIRMRAALKYDAFSKGLVLGLKYADKTAHAPVFARWMLRACHEFIFDMDVFVPVPLHWKRLFSRKYNQAGILSTALSKLTGIETDHMTLKRTVHTPKQGRLKKRERAQNVKEAFDIGKRNGVSGKKVLLIDDVVTSGATVNECTKTLLSAGAAEVYVAALSRVTQSGDPA